MTKKKKKKNKKKRDANNVSEQGTPLRVISVNMPRRKGKSGKANTVPLPRQSSQAYGMRLSRQHLEERGFHPAVTSQTPQEMIREARTNYAARSNRPDRGDVVSWDSRERVTLAPLFFRANTHRDAFPADRIHMQGDKGVVGLLRHFDVGPLIVKALAHHGIGNVQALAATSIESWHLVAGHVRIYDFLGNGFHTDGASGTLLVAAPAWSVNDFDWSHTRLSSNDHTHHPLDNRSRKFFIMEQVMASTLLEEHLRGGYTHPPWLPAPQTPHQSAAQFDGHPTQIPRARSVMRYLRRSNDIVNCCRLPHNEAHLVYRAPYFAELLSLRHLVEKMYAQRASIKVLQFYKTPMLDARMIAVMLRGCERVTALGIYQCPLVGFGDLICLLDLIHEVNVERRSKNIPQVSSFDFFPRYHAGMPYKHSTAAEHGIFWGPHSIDIVQPGFYMIVMKAFLKCHAMGLTTLFSEGSALRKYLTRVPNAPLGVASFLDALLRYLEFDARSPGAAVEKQRIIYDLLKPVRIGNVPNLDRDWPDWINEVMGRNMLFCCSCGYEAFEEFFSNGNNNLQPWQRVCGSCQLQRLLDLETDHHKPEKMAALKILFPAWNPSDFNVDAPLPAAAKGILNLVSISHVRPPPPSAVMDQNGNLHMPPYTEPLVRDRKLHSDSLQRLPTLCGLAMTPIAGTLWTTSYLHGFETDLCTRTIQLLTQEGYQDDPPNQFGRLRVDGGLPDSIDEQQPFSRDPRYQSHNTVTALMLLVDLERRGW